ncbi:MAG: UDP-3-O-acyl-N-acetylglucosamine deacetylase [Gemmataceae bacterium]
MRRHSYRAQRTLCRAAEVVGPGMLTGRMIHARFVPAAASTGVVFVRRDLAGHPRIPAHISRVSGTTRRTTLGRDRVSVTLVEHVLAALSGLRIDNCLVELDGPEPPGLDGSAAAFVAALEEAGIQTQTALRSVWQVQEPLSVRSAGAILTLHPPSQPGLHLSYFLDYGPYSPIARQVHTQELLPRCFARELAPCRTFVLESEAAALRHAGLGTHLTERDLLVFGSRGPIGNALRFANEPARHKVLDMVGDLSLLGVDLCGHVVAYRSGHPLNVELAEVLHRRLVAALSRVAA